MDNLIEIKSLSKSFMSNNNSQLVLDDINLSIPESSFLTVLGPSGCGKTTLLRCIGGFEAASSGNVYFNNQPVIAPTPAIGMVFQDFNQLFPWKTVMENIVFTIKNTSKEITPKSLLVRAEEYLSLVELSSFSNYYPHELSGGMKQRVSIARALALGSDVVLMDEPFASLDAETRTTLQVMLHNLWKQTNKTFLFVTHNIWEAIILGSDILVLSPAPNNIELLISNPIISYDGPIRTPSEKGFVECWELLKNTIVKSKQKY